MSRPTNTLQVTTPSDREIVLTRVFDAPRELVFEAWTNPERTVTFTEEGGRTLTTVITIYPTREVCDLVLGTGMEQGAAESYDRLADHLKTLA